LTEITREKLDKLYNKQKKTMLTIVGISTAGFIIIFSAARIYEDKSASELPITTAAIFIMAAALFIAAAIAKKKIIPAGNGPAVQDASRSLQRDFLSDHAVDMLYRKICQTSNYPDKTKLMLLLCDVYMMRGQYNEALNMLGSVDRSRFSEYPEVGMSFFDDTLFVYTELGDNDSVLRAYEDAKPFIEHCAERNYLCCSTALNIMITAEKARGNYRHALDMKLMKNEFENKLNQSTSAASVQTSPLTQYLRGCVFYDTAELFYLCGDYANAAKYLDIGGPMLAVCPTATQKANRLSDSIRNAMGINNK